MKWSILFLLSILITGCAQNVPECPCEPIPEEQTQHDSSIQTTEFYSRLNAKIDAQVKMVKGNGNLDIAFKDLSELRSDYFTRLGFNHNEVRQYNLIVNQLCNVWRNIHSSQNDEETKELCHGQYLEGLQDLQSLIRKTIDSKSSSISLSEFLGKSEIEIATIQLEIERAQQPNAIADLNAVIAQIQHLMNLAQRDSSKVEFCNQKLETITKTYKKY